MSQWIHTTKDFEGSCCGTGQGHTIISWNVKGLSELGRNKEINSLLPSLKPNIIILIDTRVKQRRVVAIRKKLHFRWSYFDNYTNHDNGRVWVMWVAAQVKVTSVYNTYQMLHCGVYTIDGKFKHWLTTIYAYNQLTHRRTLLEEY